MTEAAKMSDIQLYMLHHRAQQLARQKHRPSPEQELLADWARVINRISNDTKDLVNQQAWQLIMDRLEDAGVPRRDRNYLRQHIWQQRPRNVWRAPAEHDHLAAEEANDAAHRQRIQNARKIKLPVPKIKPGFQKAENTFIPLERKVVEIDWPPSDQIKASILHQREAEANLEAIDAASHLARGVAKTRVALIAGTSTHRLNTWLKKREKEKQNDKDKV